MADFEVSENEAAVELRSKINRVSDRMLSVVTDAGLNPTVVFSYPAHMGIRPHEVNLITGLFLLRQFKPVNYEPAIDILDRAIGVYEADSTHAWIRTVNPLFWIATAVDWVASLPFKLIGRIGLNQERAEASWIGKSLKGALLTTQWLALVITIFAQLGILELVKSAVRSLFVGS